MKQFVQFFNNLSTIKSCAIFEIDFNSPSLIKGTYIYIYMYKELGRNNINGGDVYFKYNS